MGILNEPLCIKIQQKVGSLITPVHAGRLPGKICTVGGFSSLTAEQWMIWTIVYSPFVLKDILPHRHYEMWCTFSKSCSLMCRPFIHHTELKKADELMMQFCNSFENILENVVSLLTCTYMDICKNAFKMLDLCSHFGATPSNTIMAF